uniref:Uncharacterized protein n=1 Tax=Ciona intestinalis TaxID=7719 RepID=H2Y3I8_CIOIN
MVYIALRRAIYRYTLGVSISAAFAALVAHKGRIRDATKLRLCWTTGIQRNSGKSQLV